MKCLHPIVLKQYNEDGIMNSIMVGCGKCYYCLSLRRSHWLMRLMYEQLCSSLSLFVTLTYSDEYIPSSLTVDKKYLSNFCKKLRNRNYKFRYYGIGEYGSKKGRAHYHICLFLKNKTLSDYNNIVDDIQSLHYYGRIQALLLTPRLTNYILHYHINPKSVNGRDTFQIFSKGLGKNFLVTEEMQNYVLSGKSLITLSDGSVVSIPRYYRKLLGSPPIDIKHSNYLKDFILNS